MLPHIQRKNRDVDELLENYHKTQPMWEDLKRGKINLRQGLTRLLVLLVCILIRRAVEFLFREK